MSPSLKSLPLLLVLTIVTIAPATPQTRTPKQELIEKKDDEVYRWLRTLSEV